MQEMFHTSITRNSYVNEIGGGDKQLGGGDKQQTSHVKEKHTLWIGVSKR